MTRWKIAAVVLSGAILAASCSTGWDDTGWDDSERAAVIQSCLNLDLTYDELEGRYETDCTGIVEEYEKLGCTPEDGEGLMVSMLSNDPAMWEGLPQRYPSCYGIDTTIADT